MAESDSSPSNQAPVVVDAVEVASFRLSLLQELKPPVRVRRLDLAPFKNELRHDLALLVFEMAF
jgi:hypothetical protein